MATAIGRDRLRTLIDVLVGSLDDPGAGEELARRAHLSRFHFDRLVAAALGESSGAFRRRLLLERAAYQLSSGTSVYRSVVGLGAVFSRLDRWAGRFNRWFGSAAVAAGAEHSGSAGGPPTLDPTAVVAGLGEIERERGFVDEGDDSERRERPG